jgi:hypothetical protein
MRSRFAIVIAAAVVFAPGWYGQTASPPGHAGDIIARVLAPTVGEAAMPKGTTDVKLQLSVRQLKRWPPSFDPLPAMGATMGSTALLVLWIVALYPARPVFVYRFSRRLSRAPPRFQPA